MEDHLLIAVSGKEAQVYDLLGLHCPLPVLRTAKRLSGMRPGERLCVETTDPLAVIDIPAYCTEKGHRLIETVAMGNTHRFLIERG